MDFVAAVVDTVYIWFSLKAKQTQLLESKEMGFELQVIIIILATPLDERLTITLATRNFPHVALRVSEIALCPMHYS